MLNAGATRNSPSLPPQSPGLAFLNKKGFHTKRLDNIERIWVLEQKKANEEKYMQEKIKQLQVRSREL